MTTMSAALGGFLTSVATTYAKAVDRRLSTVSLAAADDPNVLPRIAAAPGTANFTIDRFDRIITWFRENWPHDTRWPATPAWPYAPPIPLPPAGEHNGKNESKASSTSTRRRRRSDGQTEARAAAKPKQGAKGRKGRQRPQQASGGTEPG